MTNPGEILKVKKRNGSIVEFDVSKIGEAIFRAAQSVGGTNKKLAYEIAQQVSDYIRTKTYTNNIPSVEQVQDAVEKVLFVHVPAQQEPFQQHP